MPRAITAAPLVAAALLALSACSDSASRATDPDVHSSEAETHASGSCPARLPEGDDPGGHGFGVEAAAEDLPSLLEPEQAWLCQYGAQDAAPTPAGAVFTWDLVGGSEPVPAARMAKLGDALDDLSVPEGERLCTADLGPRWMVVFDHGGDLTGVVVDDYGCRDVRLTDEPFETPPGQADENGMVTGVLDGGSAVLAALGVGR
jgi:hypothetical protein